MVRSDFKVQKTGFGTSAFLDELKNESGFDWGNIKNDLLESENKFFVRGKDAEADTAVILLIVRLKIRRFNELSIEIIYRVRFRSRVEDFV